MEPRFFVIMTTLDNEQNAKELARRIVEEKLSRCVQIIPGLISVYHWENKIHEDPEFLLLIKLPKANLESALELIPRWHPYEVPELIALPVKVGHDPYLQWLGDWQYKQSP